MPNALGDPAELHPAPIRCRRRPRSCRNGTSCRSTRSCARCRTSSSSRRSSPACSAMFGSIWLLFVAALARHLAGAQRALPPDLQMGLLAAGDRRASCSAMSARIGPKGCYIVIGRIATLYYFLHFLDPAAAASASSSGRCRCRASISAAVTKGGRQLAATPPARWRSRDAQAPRHSRLTAAVLALGRAAACAAGGGRTAAAAASAGPSTASSAPSTAPPLQRGFQVYNEVCSNCHSLNLLTYRDLTGARLQRGPDQGDRGAEAGDRRPQRPGRACSSARRGRPIISCAPFPNEQARARRITARCRPISRSSSRRARAAPITSTASSPATARRRRA